MKADPKNVVAALRRLDNEERWLDVDSQRTLAAAVRLMANYICGPEPHDVYAIAAAVVTMETPDDS